MNLLVAQVSGLVLLALVVLADVIALGLVDDGQDARDGLANDLAETNEPQRNKTNILDSLEAAPLVTFATRSC